MTISVISILMTEKKMEEKLKWIPCIWYSVTFKNQTEALVDSRKKVNIINQAFTS